MDNVHVSFHLIFSLESNIALVLALLIWTKEMSLSEVLLERFILFVIDVFVIISAKMACQMISAEMVIELKVVIVEFFTEVAPWMWKYFCASFIGGISVFYVRP